MDGGGNGLSEDGIVNIKGEKEMMMMMRWRELFDAYLVAQSDFSYLFYI
jgi:hypothetical protein